MRSNLSGKIFLLVDDEPDIRDFLRWEVEDRGGRVIEAGTVDEAVSVFLNSPPDFCLVDVRMPGATGVDFLVEIKKRFPAAAVALMTGYTEISVCHIYAKGACDVFVKPLNYEQLFPRIDKEILPMEERFCNNTGLAPVETFHFSDSFFSLMELKQLQLGRGGFSLVSDVPNNGDVNKIYQLDFLEHEQVLVRLCWVERDQFSQQVFGFELIDASQEIKGGIIERMKELKTPSYIPFE